MFQCQGRLRHAYNASTSVRVMGLLAKASAVAKKRSHLVAKVQEAFGDRECPRLEHVASCTAQANHQRNEAHISLCVGQSAARKRPSRQIMQ